MTDNAPFSRALRLAFLLAWILLTALLFAQVEIQIEGAQGWAGGLPTWRIDSNPWLSVFFGGRPVTGYHLFVFSFMLVAFHFPIALAGRWTWRSEALILGSLMLFWIIEDALWFVMNPAFGIHCLSPAGAPWHPHWILGLPIDYFVFTTMAAGLWYAALRSPKSS
jgi:hypothetical protein